MIPSTAAATRYRPIAHQQSVDVSERACLMRLETSETMGPSHFQLQGCQIGLLSLTRHDSRGQEHGTRTIEHIRNNPQDSFILFLPVQANFEFAHAGRYSRISQGSAVLLSARRTFDAYAAGDTHDALLSSFHLRVPGALLRKHIANIDDLCNRDIPVSTGAGAILQNVLQILFREVATLKEPQGAQIGSALTDLISACIGQLDSTADTRTPDRSVFQRALDYIECRLSESTLCSESIAAYCRVSRRSLDKSFEQNGMTVASRVRDMRLERCREALRDEHLAHHSIIEIASRWGFNDPSHFGRLYKKRFGLRPGQDRQRAGCSESGVMPPAMPKQSIRNS